MSMMPFRMSRRALLATAPLLAMPLGGGRAVAAGGDFYGFLAGVRRGARASGIRPATVDLAFRYIQFVPRVIELDQRQPDHVLSFAEFITKVVNPQRIEDARRNLAENSALLQRVQQRFNVQPRFIVALWGVESDFGKTQGSYSVPAALATLAYEGRRGPMFRGELITSLKILDQGHIRAENMLGSWAGAMGQCQFMPSTFLSYAVDFDGDGRRDIWNNRADVLGSIANYLARLGFILSACASSGPQFGEQQHSGYHRGQPSYKVGSAYQINGKWYYPKVDYSYDQTGLASWYGEAFDGKATANGEIFNLNELSAAHKTLPLPSVVEVSNLRNGRSLRLRVNDRGPYVDARIIDVSRRAAQLLGFEMAGTTPVRVRILKDER